MRNSSCASFTCSSGPKVRAVSTICMIRLIGGGGSIPSRPFDVTHFAKSGPSVRIGELRGSNFALPVNGNAVVSSFQTSAISSLASRIAELERPFADLHHRLDPDCLPIFGDELRHVGPGAEGGHDADLDRDRLPVCHQPNALRITL